MGIRDDRSAGEYAALEAMSTQELKDLLCQMYDAPALSGEDSERMLAITEVLSAREDSGCLRVDTGAALKTFREVYLPSAETDPEEPAEAPYSVKRRAEHGSGTLPAFLAAFSAGKKPTPEEAEELQQMIDDFRKEQ